MTTIDKILKEISAIGFDKLQPSLPKRDVKILKNLVVLITRPEYISENQGKLLIKIFNENISSLSFLNLDLAEILKSPSWSRPFRKIIQTRKIGIFQADTGEKSIQLEFTFTSTLKKILQNLTKSIQDGTSSVTIVSGRIYRIPLTEKNLVLVVDAFKNHNFEVSTEILSFYETIKSWDGKEFKKNFEIFSESNSSLRETIKKMLNLETEPSELILSDRKIQFQYQFLPKKTEDTLTSIIANRTSSKVYVNSTTYSMIDLVASLKELHRLPLLVVFNGYSETESLKNLEILSQALENSKIDDRVGIYFRFENTNSGKVFNQTIAEKKYNSFLDTDINCAGIIGGKIPKFFLSSAWRPQAVISFTNNLKHNKASVYCNSCDLIVYYNEKKPLIINNNDL
jgi:hypothetical protein